MRAVLRSRALYVYAVPAMAAADHCCTQQDPGSSSFVRMEGGWASLWGGGKTMASRGDGVGPVKGATEITNTGANTHDIDDIAYGVTGKEMDETIELKNTIANNTSTDIKSSDGLAAGGCMVLGDNRYLKKERRKKKRTFRGSVTGQEMGDVRNKYTIEKKEIGAGLDSTVRVGRCRLSGVRYAVKTVRKSTRLKEMRSLQGEVASLSLLKGVKGVVQVHEVFEDMTHVHLVEELCSGGELFDRIMAKGHYTEAAARRVICMLLKAVGECHKRGVAHRDLKPENFILADKSENPAVVIVDFGFSCVCVKEDERTGAKLLDQPRVMTEVLGTPFYIAPEVLGGAYTNKCDVWSLGVVLYVLLCGYPPFFGGDDHETYQMVKQDPVRFDTTEWQGVSPLAKELVKQMLTKDAATRPSAAQCLGHPWFQQSDADLGPNQKRAISALQEFVDSDNGNVEEGGSFF